ncbi:unnamed protein product, partial [Symbiodinium pilosum]
NVQARRRRISNLRSRSSRRSLPPRRSWRMLERWSKSKICRRMSLMMMVKFWRTMLRLPRMMQKQKKSKPKTRSPRMLERWLKSKSCRRMILMTAKLRRREMPVRLDQMKAQRRKPMTRPVLQRVKRRLNRRTPWQLTSRTRRPRCRQMQRTPHRCHAAVGRGGAADAQVPASVLVADMLTVEGGTRESCVSLAHACCPDSSVVRR